MEMGREKILVVDDDETVRKPISIILEKNGYRPIVCSSVEEALSELAGCPVAVIISDIVMPGASGMELLDSISTVDPDIPVILMTGASETEYAVDAFGKGAFNFLTKPCKSDKLIGAVEKALRYRDLVRHEKNYMAELEETVSARTAELNEALLVNQKLTDEITRRLITIAELKDPESRAHIERMGLYAGVLAEALGMPGAYAAEMRFAAPMHDIGKVAIPESILLKPGSLTPEEREIMKSHTTIGSRLLSGSGQRGIQMAASIAHTHHERPDGTGYPSGLRGEEIPLEGRIVRVCDCYDAIRSKRPYKPPLSHGEAVRIITEGSEHVVPERHFDPSALAAFIAAAPAFEEIFEANRD